jgi:HPt (histidine-containing phosphotransfer) domain-containing protein
MDDYLIKPFSLEDMIRCLDRWCPGARIANVPAAAPDGSKAARSAPAEPEECFSSRVFDQAHIENLRRKKPGLWSALRAAFLGEAEAARNAVALAVESRDWATVRLVAHTMKSAAANVGAVRLCEVSKALEVAAKTGDLDACTAQAAEFDSLMRTVCAAMERDRGEPLAGAAR